MRRSLGSNFVCNGRRAGRVCGSPQFQLEIIMEIYARNLFRILRESLIRVKEIHVTTTVHDANDVYVVQWKKGRSQLNCNCRLTSIRVEIRNERKKKMDFPFHSWMNSFMTLISVNRYELHHNTWLWYMHKNCIQSISQLLSNILKVDFWSNFMNKSSCEYVTLNGVSLKIQSVKNYIKLSFFLIVLISFFLNEKSFLFQTRVNK